MSEHENNLLKFQPEQYDHNKLNQDVRELQRLVRAKNTEISELRLQLSKSTRTVVSQGQDKGTTRVGREHREQLIAFSGIQDGEAQESQFHSFNSQRWIRAQKDYPDDMSCFGRRYPTVLVYDLHEENFYLCRVNEPPDPKAIISRLPSRWCSAIHAYIEIDARSPTHQVKVTTKQRANIGMIHYCSIRLRKLSNVTRLRILLGEIRWLFIKVP
ncbi:hypothetical protein GGR58DRAFT_507664 [Xylaria digitata]|nr:hypothetical protein GGR58DRAFT_507664 [Xylaria digitata]